MMAARSRRVAALTVALAVGGCGGRPAISAAAAADLQAKARDVRAAVVAQDRVAAESSLNALRQAVDRWQSQKQLSDKRAKEVLDAAGAVALQLPTLPEPTTTTSEDTTTTEQDKQDEHKKKGKGDQGPHG